MRKLPLLPVGDTDLSAAESAFSACSPQLAPPLTLWFLLSPRRGRLLPAPIMIIYRDLISHDEMFSDIYNIWEVALAGVAQWTEY